jgi:hypothetical protein
VPVHPHQEWGIKHIDGVIQCERDEEPRIFAHYDGLRMAYFKSATNPLGVVITGSHKDVDVANPVGRLLQQSFKNRRDALGLVSNGQNNIDPRRHQWTTQPEGNPCA